MFLGDNLRKEHCENWGSHFILWFRHTVDCLHRQYIYTHTLSHTSGSSDIQNRQTEKESLDLRLNVNKFETNIIICSHCRLWLWSLKYNMNAKRCRCCESYIFPDSHTHTHWRPHTHILYTRLQRVHTHTHTLAPTYTHTVYPTAARRTRSSSSRRQVNISASATWSATHTFIQPLVHTHIASHHMQLCHTLTSHINRQTVRYRNRYAPPL
jgi:hypothetical protein